MSWFCPAFWWRDSNLKGATVAKCTVCSSILSIASGGKTLITDHLQIKKHKNALLAKSQLECMTKYFRKLAPSKAEYNLDIYAGTYAYHTLPPYNHSFHSMDWTSLQRKYSCARTKCESIVGNVCAPWVLEELKINSNVWTLLLYLAILLITSMWSSFQF
jgi:hypothetical protein